MKRRILYCIGLVLSIFVIFTACQNSPEEPADGEYTIQVEIINIPADLGKSEVKIYVSRQLSDVVSLGDGGIDDYIINGVFKKTVKEMNLNTDEIGTDDKKYEGDVIISVDVYIDVDGNGEMNDVADIADAVTYQNIAVSKETTITLDYTKLHVAGN